jgi:hypothetical protein
MLQDLFLLIRKPNVSEGTGEAAVASDGTHHEPVIPLPSLGTEVPITTMRDRPGISRRGGAHGTPLAALIAGDIPDTPVMLGL